MNPTRTKNSSRVRRASAVTAAALALGGLAVAALPAGAATSAPSPAGVTVQVPAQWHNVGYFNSRELCVLVKNDTGGTVRPADGCYSEARGWYFQQWA